MEILNIPCSLITGVTANHVLWTQRLNTPTRILYHPVVVDIIKSVFRDVAYPWFLKKVSS
jgi:flagellar biosynthesis regulator FlbT